MVRDVKQFLYFRQLLAGWARRMVGQVVSIFQAAVGGLG